MNPIEVVWCDDQTWPCKRLYAIFIMMTIYKNNCYSISESNHFISSGLQEYIIIVMIVEITLIIKVVVVLVVLLFILMKHMIHPNNLSFLVCLWDKSFSSLLLLALFDNNNVMNICCVECSYSSWYQYL